MLAAGTGPATPVPVINVVVPVKAPPNLIVNARIPAEVTVTEPPTPPMDVRPLRAFSISAAGVTVTPGATAVAVIGGTGTAASEPPKTTTKPARIWVTVTEAPLLKIGDRLFKSVWISIARVGEATSSAGVLNPSKESLNVPE